MKKQLALLVSCLSICSGMSAATINFELRNHETYPISLKLIQQAGARYEMGKIIKSSATRYQTTVPAKTATKVSSVQHSVDTHKPTYVIISYYQDGGDVTLYYGLPSSKNLFLAFENGQLRPQKGTFFGKVTQSGLSLSNNVPEKLIMRLTEQDIRLVEDNSQYMGK
ncbi:hypothetical protein Noda2021_05230 [Candidatus Dependentiae bacterium Noda2021]|nr:hypothetical protein Noda2021_05230 [Candidatus Dependentiae bacterium Noda2021]